MYSGESLVKLVGGNTGSVDTVVLPTLIDQHNNFTRTFFMIGLVGRSCNISCFILVVGVNHLLVVTG